MPYKTYAVLLVALVLAGGGAAVSRAQGKPVKAGQELEFGVKMAQRGLWSEALFRFQQAEKRGDTRPALYNNIAVAYEALGVFEKAQEYYKKALDADPRNAPLRRNYSRFVEFYQSFQPAEEEGGADDEETGDAEAEAAGATGSS